MGAMSAPERGAELSLCRKVVFRWHAGCCMTRYSITPRGNNDRLWTRWPEVISFADLAGSFYKEVDLLEFSIRHRDDAASAPGTRVRKPHSFWSNAAPGSCSCSRTVRTGILLSNSSPRSRRSCAKPKPAPLTRSGGPLVEFAFGSRQRNAATTSPPRAMDSSEPPVL